MYVIYVNDRPLRLLPGPEPGTGAGAPETHLTARYAGKPHALLQYVDMLEKGSPKVRSVDVVHEDVERLWDDFRGHYKWVPAAGGVVRRRDTAEVLFIYRRDFWDLPKGKLDDGEDAPTAALREVTEETGVADLTLRRELPTTFHTYRGRKEKRILKPTYWFEMETDQIDLTPEKEEDIELARWRSLAELLRSGEPIYASLRSLLQTL